jgi:hypothetical protein
MNKTIKIVLLVMVGLDLAWHICELSGYFPYRFPTQHSYQVFWVSYWGAAFLMLLKINLSKK